MAEQALYGSAMAKLPFTCTVNHTKLDNFFPLVTVSSEFTSSLTLVSTYCQTIEKIVTNIHTEEETEKFLDKEINLNLL